jgi:xanthine dehydrogenase YagT iron-sulfur-binding subunit
MDDDQGPDHLASEASANDAATQEPGGAADAAVNRGTVTLRVNGIPRRISASAGTSLLDAVRDHLDLTGTKKGCSHGECGACTVILDGVRVKSCLSLVMLLDGASVVTIEGIADPDGTPHLLQSAFVHHDALQCGFCTAGQIMSAIGFLRENVMPTEAEIREGMGGNLCRCGAYPNIIKAVRDVSSKQIAASTTPHG